MPKKKTIVIISRWDAPPIEDEYEHTNSFDELPSIERELVVDHNEDTHRNVYCNFGQQYDSDNDWCNCRDISVNFGVSVQKPSWLYPDCYKMLPQYDMSEILYLIDMGNRTIECPLCKREYRAYEQAMDHEGNLICPECFADRCFICEGCSNTFSIDIQEDIGDHKLCDRCIETFVICEGCDDLIDRDSDTYWYDEDNDCYYCSSCMDDVSFICDWCSGRFSNDYSHFDDHHTTLCDDCYACSSSCDSCGRYISDGDGYSVHDGEELYCEDCYSDYRENRCLHDYSYEPSLRFCRVDGEETQRFFGWELEIDNGDIDCASKLENEIGDIYLKTDGSLSDDGIEIVSHPMSYRYITESFEWDKMINICKRYHYRGHDAHGDCGLHVHISRKAFGDNDDTQDKNVSKLLYLVEKYWTQMTLFSRRHQSSINSWAKRYGHIIEDDDEPAMVRKMWNNHDRHVCVNLRTAKHNRPARTVEIRIFRSSLNKRTLIATLQFCNLLVDLVTEYGLAYIQGLTWDDIKSHGDVYPELKEYFVQRGL